MNFFPLFPFLILLVTLFEFSSFNLGFVQKTQINEEKEMEWILSWEETETLPAQWWWDSRTGEWRGREKRENSRREDSWGGGEECHDGGCKEDGSAGWWRREIRRAEEIGRERRQSVEEVSLFLCFVNFFYEFPQKEAM